MTLPQPFTFTTGWLSLSSSILLSKDSKKNQKITIIVSNNLNGFKFRKQIPNHFLHHNFSPPIIPHSALRQPTLRSDTPTSALAQPSASHKLSTHPKITPTAKQYHAPAPLSTSNRAIFFSVVASQTIQSSYEVKERIWTQAKSPSSSLR